MADYEEELEPNDWVVVKDPIKHREIATEVAIEFRKTVAESKGVFYIDTLLDTGITNDLWLCDFCNDKIPVFVEGSDEKLPITIWNNSRALCESCLKEFKEKWTTDKDETYNCRCGCSETINEEE